MRAQAWSLDFISSVTVFFMILVVLFFAWEYSTYQSTEQMVFNEMENKAIITVDTLIRTRGYPEFWSSSDVEILGLASEENVLNETKILEFVGMDYGQARSLLGIPSQNFHFSLMHLNGSVVRSQGTDLESGLDPTLFTNTTLVVPVERYILFDHRVARVRFILWH